MIRIKLEHVELELDDSEEKLTRDRVVNQLERAFEISRLVKSYLDIPYPNLTIKENLQNLVSVVHNGLVEIIVANAKRTEKIALVLYAYNPLSVPLRILCMSINEPISIIKNYLNNDPYREFVISDEYDMISLTAQGIGWIHEKILPRFTINADAEDQE